MHIQHKKVKNNMLENVRPIVLVPMFYCQTYTTLLYVLYMHIQHKKVLNNTLENVRPIVLVPVFYKMIEN